LRSFLSKKLVLGVTGVAVLVGGGSAVAATLSSPGSAAQTYVNDVAKHLNVTPSALTAAIKAADEERIEAALAAGRISASQAAKLKQRVQQGSLPFFAGRSGGGGRGRDEKAAARYLGVDQATLRRELQSGKSGKDT